MTYMNLNEYVEIVTCIASLIQVLHCHVRLPQRFLAFVMDTSL